MRTRSRRVSLLAWLGLVALAPACLPGGRPPDFAPPPRPQRGAGFLVRGGPAASVSGPVKLVFASPQGENIKSPEPTVVFDRPVRAVGQPPLTPALQARISPPIAGRWVWSGSNTARFVAEGTFHDATEYTVEIEPGLRALDGSTLAEPVHLRFSTPRPSMSTNEQAEQLRRPRQAVSLSFSQPIELDTLQRTLRVETAAGTSIAFTLEALRATWGGYRTVVTPVGLWPDEETIRITLPAGTVSQSGPLPTTRDQVYLVSTLSLPHVTGMGCDLSDEDHCAHGSEFTIQLSEPVRLEELRRLLRVTPAIALTLKASDTSKTVSDRFVVSARFEDEKRYTLEVLTPEAPRRPGPARSPGGSRGRQDEPRALVRGASVELRFAPQTPSVLYSFGGEVLPLSEKAELGAANNLATQASVAGRRLDPDTILALEMAPDRAAAAAQLPGWNFIELTPVARALGPWSALTPSAPVGPGSFLFLDRWKSGKNSHTGSRLLQRTDLGLTTRATPDRTLVWVTRLSTGAPAEGVSVEVRDSQGHQSAGTTDREGLVDLPTPGFGAPRSRWRRHLSPEKLEEDRVKGLRLVFARQGEDLAYLQTDVPEAAKMNSVLFTDRGLYRPGETIHIKGYVRRQGAMGMEPPEGLPITLWFREPSGTEPGREFDIKLSAWGSFSQDITLRPDSPLGYYRTGIRDAGGLLEGSTYLMVEEYHPIHFQATSRLDREQYIRGDQLKCEVQARYLYGGSMEKSEVDWELNRRPTAFRIPGLPDHEIGGEIDEIPGESREEKSAKSRRQPLDQAGHATAERRLDNPGQAGPELIECEATVHDINYELAGSTSTALVHPGEVYVALERPGRRLLAPGESITPRVLTPTPEGRLRSMPVRLKLWHQPREISGKKPPPRLIQGCAVTTGDKATGCALQAPATRVDPGDHFVVRASTRDGRGNEIRSGLRYYPTTDIPVPPRLAPAPRARVSKDALDMGFRECELVSGATAHVSLRSPFVGGHALVTIERSAILEHHVIALDQPETRLDLPLTDADAPWVKVHAVAVSPITDQRRDRHVREAIGKLKVTPTPRALDVKLRPSKTRLAPGEELDVEVEVLQGNGRPAPAEVTLYAADEGTLQLARYQLPEPLHWLYDRRDSSVDGQNNRNRLGWAYDWKAALERGGGVGFGRFIPPPDWTEPEVPTPPTVRMGATTSSPPRRDFRQMALFLPDLVTDEQGRVRAHFALPDSTTAFRLMAVAVTKGDQAGSAETSLTTSKRLQVNPSVPRVLRTGDRFEVLANVANNGREALEAQVSLRAPGLEPQAPPPRRVSLGPGERTTVAFPFAALHAGSGELTMQVSSPLDSDATVVPVVVVPPLAPETQSIYGQTDGAVVEQLGDLSRQRADVGGLDVTLSTTPLAGLGAGLEQLLDYPYQYTEQLVSRLVPLLLRDLARATHTALPSDLDAAAQRIVEKIQNNQQRDGRFALWPGQFDKGVGWATIHAFWGLQEARRHGINVSTEAFHRARERVIEMALRWSASDHDAALAAQALDVLADGSEPPPHLGTIASQLFAHRAELPVFARARLLHAVARLRSPADEQATLVKELEGALQLDGPLVRVATRDDRYLDQLDSEVRTSALVLRALVASSPEHPLLGGLAQGLLADRKGGAWRTTHETTWALLALDDFRRTLPQGATQVDARVTLGGLDEPLLATHFAGEPGELIPEERAKLSMEALVPHSPADLTIEARGGWLYYQARLRVSPQAMPTEPLSVGLGLQRRYYLLTKQDRGRIEQRLLEDTPVTSVPQGAFVWVQLDLLSPGPRRHVVVDDPLPGGFEALRDGGADTPEWLYSHMRHLNGSRESWKELRDDRVVFVLDKTDAGTLSLGYIAHALHRGAYVTPPARAEEMYTPETMGRTEALSFSVVEATPASPAPAGR
jgi:hypothetical protein